MDEHWKEALKTQLKRISPGRTPLFWALGLGKADPLLVVRKLEIPLAQFGTVAATETRLTVPATTVVMVGTVDLDQGNAVFTIDEMKGNIQLTTVTTTLRKLSTELGGVSVLARCTVVPARSEATPSAKPETPVGGPLRDALVDGDGGRYDALCAAFGGDRALVGALGTKDPRVYRPFLDTLCDRDPARFKSLVDAFGADRLRALSATWGGSIP